MATAVRLRHGAEPVEGDVGVYSGGEDIRPITYEQAQKWYKKA